MLLPPIFIVLSSFSSKGATTRSSKLLLFSTLTFSSFSFLPCLFVDKVLVVKKSYIVHHDNITAILCLFSYGIVIAYVWDVQVDPKQAKLFSSDTIYVGLVVHVVVHCNPATA
ncbi:unnamed protein product [Linum trigynum]|uniref:Uncharacterized protein n=1 Tax=Linum trigynum TaxID=586398 RepID=A0AAV2CFW6_9ROSI